MARSTVLVSVRLTTADGKLLEELCLKDGDSTQTDVIKRALKAYANVRLGSECLVMHEHETGEPKEKLFIFSDVSDQNGKCNENIKEPKKGDKGMVFTNDDGSESWQEYDAEKKAWVKKTKMPEADLENELH